jgi:hypothetical protein
MYTDDGISIDIPRISTLFDIRGISTLLDIRGISMDIPCISLVYRSGQHIHGIYVVYTRYIPKLEIGVPDHET